jgi:CRISPR-associated exonuclease Cas4
MTGVEVPSGMFFYGVPRRRYDVAFDDALRRRTEELCLRLHELTKEGKTPKAEYGKRCRSCSLLDSCMPKTIGRQKKVEKYLTEAFSETTGDVVE